MPDIYIFFFAKLVGVYLVSVLITTHVERFSVFRMLYFFFSVNFYQQKEPHILQFVGGNYYQNSFPYNIVGNSMSE